MNEKDIKELRAHAGKLVAEGKSLSGVFERLVEYMAGSEPDTWWEPWSHERAIPDFTDGQQWRIAQQDQHLLDDGWVRHTGDVCPVHLLDRVAICTITETKGWGLDGDRKAETFVWAQDHATRITHYKVIKKYAPPKKQIIKWEHEYFKGCATNYGELTLTTREGAYCVTHNSHGVFLENLRLATPANDESNWQYFSSSPENDAKLRELAKMVKVEARYWHYGAEKYDSSPIELGIPLDQICNFRITGECQDGWTDKKEEAQS